MATGIPSPNGKARSQSASNGPGVALSYPGKKPVGEILATPAAALVVDWAASGNSSPNGLYFGENLAVLSAMRIDPRICGNVRLVYIDPPYATRSVFQSRKQDDAYHDLLHGAEYLEFLRERLILLRDLLADDGSIYLHLDENMAFHAKILMDEVFGSSNFRNWLTRKKCNPKNYTRKTYGNVADYILFYTKGENYVWHRPVEAWTDQGAAREYNYTEPGTGRKYKKVPIHAPGVRNGETGKPWRGMSPPPGKHWQYVPTTLDEMDARGEIYWSPTGNPRRKIYLDQSGGIPVQDIWLDFRDAHNQNIRITGYPTEKNPALLARIIAASSNPGDIILDCFSGSGTTLEAAHRLGRHWLGVDNSAEAIRTTLTRFARGIEPMGDFVRRMELEDAAAPNGDPQTMFDLDLSPSKTAQDQSDHEPILNFTLYRDTGIPPAEFLSEWPMPTDASGGVNGTRLSTREAAVVCETPHSQAPTAPSGRKTTYRPNKKAKQ